LGYLDYCLGNNGWDLPGGFWRCVFGWGAGRAYGRLEVGFSRLRGGFGRFDVDFSRLRGCFGRFGGSFSRLEGDFGRFADSSVKESHAKVL
jgi:hypothetical protein